MATLSLCTTTTLTNLTNVQTAEVAAKSLEDPKLGLLTCCALLAESSLLGRDEVLVGIVQLAAHMLTACTAAHWSLSAWVTLASSATAANATAKAALDIDSAQHCDVIDLTIDDVDDDDAEIGLTSQHAPDTEAAGRQGVGQPPPVQCKTEPSQQKTLPEQDTQKQQSMLSKQAGMLLQPTSGLPHQAVVPEPVRAGSARQVEAASTGRPGLGEGPPPLPPGEGAKDERQTLLSLGEGAMGEGHTPLPLQEGIMEDLCMLCAYGMDLAAVVGCLLNQVDTWPGTTH